MKGKEDVARFEEEVRRLRKEMRRLREEGREERQLWARQEQEHENSVSQLHRELEQQGRDMAELRTMVRAQAGNHVTELQRDLEGYRHLMQEEQARRRELTRRVEMVVVHLMGEETSPTYTELWELAREDVHVSQTLLGTGGWGSVVRGMFHGQCVAVKCLHRGILSPHNEGRLRREIRILSQIRHPNLLLLIGAVLTAEGEGALIVTELLDTSLHSAYEGGLLEEKSKVPVLRDVASALTYLHSHRDPILHRDVSSANVSSANVLLEAIGHDRRWKAKLSDFGSANLGHLASTPAEGAAVYAAPEVCTEDRSRQTAKIDVYSFGVLVCEVCLCRFPPERRQFPSMLSDVRCTAPNLFPLSRDCTSHAHQDRPTMKETLQRIDQL